jgi:hypothetical protein
MLVVAPDAACSAYSYFYTSMMDPVSWVVNETGENFPGRGRIAALPASRSE